MAFWPPSGAGLPKLLSLSLVCAAASVFLWLVISPPSTSEVISSRLERRDGTVYGDFYDEWWEKQQQELRLRGSNSHYANSTLLGWPSQAVCLAHGVRPQELGYAPTAAAHAGFERSMGVCLPKGAAPARLWCCDPSEAEAAQAAAHLAAAAQASAPHDQAEDPVQPPVLSTTSAVHEESGLAPAQLADADGALPPAPSTEATQQQLSLQAAVSTPASTAVAEILSDDNSGSPTAGPEAPAAANVQDSSVEALNSSTQAAAAAAQASEAATGRQHAQDSSDTGLNTDAQDTAGSAEGLRDSQRAAAPSTAHDTPHASTPLAAGFSSGLAADVLQFSAVQSLANITNKLGSYSAQLWDKVTGRRHAAAAGEDATVCAQHQGLREAYQPAAAGEECSALQGDAAAGVQDVLQEPEVLQQEEGMVQQADASGAGLDSDVPIGAFLTPDMIIQAYTRKGVLHMAWFALCTVAVAFAISCVWGKIVGCFAKKRTGLDGLPRSIRQNPKAVEAFCTLRDLCFQRKAWFRLVGVSGVAVYKTVGAQLQAANVARRAEGGASFARGLLRQQRQRMLRERDALAAELREAFDEQLAERGAAHAAVVHQHVQKQEQQAALILQQSSERADLKSQLRQKTEDIVAQKAIVARLEKDLDKAEDSKQSVQKEYDSYRQSMAKEEGRQEALQHKLQEGVKREQVLSSKIEDLQQRLTEAHSIISHLQADVQHKDEGIAARDASSKLLDSDKQQLQQDKQHLQQQVAAVTHERDDVRSHAAALQEGNDQLQQRVTDLQLEVTSLQALHGQQAQQLQDKQSRCDALQQACEQVRADLAAAGEREAGLSSRVQEQQQLLEDSSTHAQELQLQLDGERNQHDQTRIRLQHEVVQRQTAEESLRHEREEKHATGSKADGLQLQLTSTTQELAQLNTEHASTMQTLQRVQEDLAELLQRHRDAQSTISTNEQQIADLKESLRQRDRQLSLQDQQKTEDDEQVRQLQQQLAELQQQLAAREKLVEEQQVDIDQLIQLELEERGKLADCRKELQALKADHDFARERISVLEAQLLEKQQEADELESQCMKQQAREAQLIADLALQKLSLEEAQRDLNENLDKYAEEDRKNRELGAENGKLQRAVLNLTEHKRQLDEELEELTESFDQLSAQHERAQEQLEALKSATEGLTAEREALLQESLQQSTQQQQKLKEAEAEVSGLRCQRDDLEKKLYWAEMSRDQTRAAKEMAAEDALKARQALTEEKLRKTVSRTMSTPSGRGAVAASAAAAGDGSSSRPWLRSNSSVPAKRWGTVEPAYLHQHFKDPKDGTVRRCGSPTRSHSNSESTPGTPRSTATSGDGGSTQRSRALLRPTSSNASAAVQQLEGAFDEARADAAAAAAVAGGSPRAQSVVSEGSPSGSLASARMRRVTPGGSPRSRLQECSGPEEQQQQGPGEDAQQEQQQQQGRPQLQRSNSTGSIAGSNSGSASPSPGRKVAAAAAGLRSAFSDASGSVGGSPTAAAAAAAAVEGATTAADMAPVAAAVDVQSGTNSAAEQQQQQQQLLLEAAGAQSPDGFDPTTAEQQQGQEASPGPASTATATPPLEQGGRSPSLCSSGTKSRLGLADMRDMRPLALSPVQQSSGLVLIGHDTDSPGVSFSSRLAAEDAAGASILDAAAAEAAAPTGRSSAGTADASLAAAGLTAAAAAAGGVLAIMPSAVSAPGTPAATAAGCASPAGSHEGAAGGQLFFTPLPAAHSSGSSTSVVGCCSPVFAAAGGSSVKPATPYFTPAHGAAASTNTASGGGVSSPAAAAGGPVTQVVPVADEPVSNAGAGQTQPAAAGGSGRNAWLLRLPGGASHSSSPPSFSQHADDGDVVLIGSLSESDFAGIGMGGNSSSSAFHHEEQSPLAQQQPTDPTAAPAALSEQQQKQQGWELGDGQQEDAEGSVGGSSRASSPASSQAQSAQLVSLGNARGSNDCEPRSRAATVPPLPLFQLHAATAAGCGDSDANNIPGGLGALPAGGGSATGVGAGGEADYDWQIDSDDDDLASIVSNSSSSGAAAAAAAAAEEDDADAGNSGQEDTAVASDVDTTPPKMFIGNMPAAAAAVAAAAVAAGSVMHSPGTVQHSPRYHDQRAMHSPRYSNQQQQQQQHSPRYASQQQQSWQEAAAAALGDADSSGSSDDLADDSAMPDTAPRSKPASPAAAAAAAAAGANGSSRSSKGLRSSRGSPGSSPQRPSSAGAAGSPPTAGAAAAAEGASALKTYPRRSSRLSDPASSSCSSIKSLVAHSRQQQQLRRTGSNSSIGSAGGSTFTSVLGAVGGSPGVLRRSGSLDQQGFAKSLGLKQQQKGRSPGTSPSKSCIAGGSTAAGAAKAPAAAGLAVDGSLDSVSGLLQQSQSCGQFNSSSQDQQQQRRQQLHSPVGTCSPQPSAADLAGFSTPPGPHTRPVKPAAVGPPGQHRSTVMWKSLDDFVHHNRATSSSANSSPGVRRGCGIGSSSMAGLPPFLSPPAAVLVNPWSSPPAAIVQGFMQPPGLPPSARASSNLSPQASAAALQGLLPLGVSGGRASSSNLSPQGSAAALQGLLPPSGHSARGSNSLSPQGSAAALPQVLPPGASTARGSYSLSPQGSVGGRLGSPAPVTPAAATAAAVGGRVSKDGSSGQLVGVPVLPVAEGVCEGVSDADSPNSCISGESTAAEGGVEEGRVDAWTVQENPVYFELH